MNAPTLTVSPHSPYVAVVGHSATWNFAQLYMPATLGNVTSAIVQPNVQMSQLCNLNQPICNACNYGFSGATAYAMNGDCDHSIAHANICQAMQAPDADIFECKYSTSDGAAQCGPSGGKAHFSQCAVVPAWKQPTIAELNAAPGPDLTKWTGQQPTAYSAALTCAACSPFQLASAAVWNVLAFMPIAAFPCCTLQSDLTQRDWRDWNDLPGSLFCMSYSITDWKILGPKFSASRGQTAGSVPGLARIGLPGKEQFVVGAEDQSSGVQAAAGVKAGNASEFLGIHAPGSVSLPNNCFDNGVVDGAPAACPMRAMDAVIGDPNDKLGSSAWGLINDSGIAVPNPELPAQTPLSAPGSFLRLARMTKLDAAGGAFQPNIDAYPELFDWRQLWMAKVRYHLPTRRSKTYPTWFFNGLGFG